MTDELLVKAAVFLTHDPGSPGFLDRFTEAVTGDAHLAGRLLHIALTAQTRAGNASIRLGAGDLKLETTSSGASLTACALPAPGGRITAAVRLVDALRQPVEGAVLEINTPTEHQILVTNPTGWAHVGVRGPGLDILVGRNPSGELEAAVADSRPEGAVDVIKLPRIQDREWFELAAAHSRGTHEDDEPERWRVEAGGVEFLCLQRKGGYDLTLVVPGITAEFAHSAVGTYGVSFLTQDRDGRSHRWIVPLAPSPLGLAGSLYSTNENGLHVRSVEVRSAEQLIAALGDQSDEVIRRSVTHSDTLSAWTALCQRLGPGRPRTVLEAALAERENSQ